MQGPLEEMRPPGCGARAARATSGRLVALDTLRGAVIVSMVAFHAVYDLVYLYGLDVPWFACPAWQELWRVSVSWTFIALAGWMTSFSHDNLRRAGQYGAVALLVYIVTSIASVDTPISFGIVFCMAASTFKWAFMERVAAPLLDRHPTLLAVLIITAFLVLYEVPRSRYGIDGLAWLGFPNVDFHSSDYYPIIPFGLLYLASAVLSRAWTRRGKPHPAWLRRSWCPPLEFLGRHSLLIYVLHQPVILLLLEVLL